MSVIEIIDNEEPDASTRLTKPAGTSKRKVSTVLRSDLSVDSVVQAIRSGDFVLRVNETGRADYWKHFAQVVDVSDGTQMDYIACKKCKMPFKHGSKSGTTHLGDHAKNCAVAKGQSKMDAFVTTTVSSESKKAIARASAIMCAKDSRSFATCEGQGFVQFVDALLLEAAKSKSKLSASDILCDPRTVSRYVTIEANQLRKSVGEQLRAAVKSSGGSMTSDMWTEDYNKTAFMSLTYHFGQDTVLIKQLLYCAEYDVEKKKSGSEIRDFLFNQLLPFGVSESQCENVVFVTDGVGTMVKAFNPDHKDNRGKTVIERITCAGHLMNTTLSNCFNTKKNSEFLVPQAAMPIVKLFEECKKLVTHCKQTYIARRMSRKLVSACPTRWNTNLDMLDSIRNMYGEIENVLQERAELQSLPGNKDLLDEVALFLKPFKDATLALSADKSSTLHLVALHYYFVIDHVNNFEVTTSPAMQAFRDHAKKVVPAKLVLDDIHKVAMFLNPAAKHLPVFKGHEKFAIHNLVRARLAKLLKKLPVTDFPSPRLEKPPRSGIDRLLVYAECTVAQGSDEVDTYLNLPPPSKSVGLLQLWDDYINVVPGLKLLADRVLCVPATSTSSKRLFSDAGNIFTDRRTRLGTEKLDDLLFLKWNLTRNAEQ